MRGNWSDRRCREGNDEWTMDGIGNATIPCHSIRDVQWQLCSIPNNPLARIPETYMRCIPLGLIF